MSKEDFTEEELNAVYKIVKQYKEETIDSSEESDNEYYGEYEESIPKNIVISLLKRISGRLPTEEIVEINKDFLRRKYQTFNHSIDQKVYATLKGALEHLNTVEMEYFNMENAEFKKRKIDVYYTSSKYTIGYCHLKKDIRKFRTSRIGKAKIISLKYKIPTSFDKNDY